MIINVDMDGVLYDFVGTLSDFICSRKQCLEELPPVEHWDFWNSWLMVREEAEAWWQRAIKEGVLFRYGDAIPDAVRKGWERIRKFQQDK